MQTASALDYPYSTICCEQNRARDTMAANVPTDDTTCFVRNLPFSVDDDKLADIFSEIGPVKKAFLVRERGSDTHKGYGFVTFALKEDAAKAAQKLAGKKEDGRTLQVLCCSDLAAPPGHCAC